MSLDIGDIERFKIQLSRLREVPNVANEELKQIADEVAQKARDMAPIDYGDLKRAIQVGRRGAQGAGGRFVSGVSNYDIFINERHPVSDPEKRKHGVSHVGEYAWWVHEHMGWVSQPNPQFMPSAESVAAGAAKGVEAGGKFLERALILLTPGIYARINRKVLAYTESLDI